LLEQEAEDPAADHDPQRADAEADRGDGRGDRHRGCRDVHQRRPAEADEHGRRYPEHFRITFSRCIYCGLCEEACPTYAIQLTPDFEYAEYDRTSMVYEKEHLLIDGPGKYHDYSFWRIAGKAIAGKDKGEAERERPPEDVRSLLP